MELHFTPEQEAQLVQIARQERTDAERLVKKGPCACFRKMPVFAPPYARASHNPTAASSLSKLRWTPAWSRCCAHRNAYPLDTTGF
jgi:hypothetical protein